MSERPPISMLRRGHFLAPESAADAIALEALPSGKPLKVRATRGRSLGQLRLYFGLLDKLAENLDQNITGDDLHEFLKLKLGLTSLVKLRNGKIAEVPKSVAFDKMEQAEFNAYFERAVAALVEHIIPAMHLPAFEREARAMLGEPEPSSQGPGAPNKRPALAEA